MLVSERQRRELFVALETKLGSEPASTMMELLGPLANDDLARKSDIVALRSDINEVRGEINEVRGEINELRSEVRADITQLRGEFVEFRAEIRSEVKGIMPRLITANIASMMGVAGLVMAAAKLL